VKNEMFIIGYSKIRKGRSKLNYLKYLLSKYSYEGIDSREVQNLWILLADLREQDRESIEISEFQIELAQLELINIERSQFQLPKGGKRFWAIERPIWNLLLPPEEYYGMKFQSHLKWMDTLELKYVTAEKTRFPDAPYIGVGYRDKGARRKVNPGEKEVKQANAFYETKNEKVEKLTSFDILTCRDYKFKLLLNCRQFSERLVIL